MMAALIENLQYLDKVFNRDQLIRNEICLTLTNVLAK